MCISYVCIISKLIWCLGIVEVVGGVNIVVTNLGVGRVAYKIAQNVMEV